MRVLERVLGRGRRPGAGDRARGYCLWCKAHRRIRDCTREYMKNGQPRVRGYCGVCRARMSILVQD